MKYALLNGKNIEATSGSKGFCPICGSELVAKCGEVNVHHWSHKGKRNCDLWWENETEWHRSWKNKFPAEWQEVIHSDTNGEKHIADVKTDTGWVLEFQHSYLQPEERRSRNAFYSKLIWVVDGLRRKTDLAQFEMKLRKSRFGTNNTPKKLWQNEVLRLNGWIEPFFSQSWFYQILKMMKSNGIFAEYLNSEIVFCEL